MRKIILFLVFIIINYGILFGADFRAIGLDNPDEVWRYFETKAISVKMENYGGFIKVQIQGRFRMKCSYYSCPTDQPFQFQMKFQLTQNAVLTSAAMFKNNDWIEAGSVNVLTAEEIFNQTPKSDARLLMRQRILRNYNGAKYSEYEMLLSPIDKYNDFVFKIEYFVKAKPSLWQMRTEINPSNFFTHYDKEMQIPIYFLDVDRNDANPKFIFGIYNPSNFLKQPDGYWKATVRARDISYSDVGISWWRPFSNGPELRRFENEDGNYYHLMLTPPLKPNERKSKNVLIIYDLADAIPYNHSRITLFNEFKVMAVSGLSDLDSINVLLTDFISTLVRKNFIPATNQNVEQLFTEIKNAPQPHLSSLPQLLRTAKDYFNEQNRDGEIWIISSATKHSKPTSVANEIIDLSLRKIQNEVVFKIFDCGYPDYYDNVYVNGNYYSGNQYLYQNLARLSKGAMVTALNTSNWFLRDALVDVFFPALDAVELDVIPSAGYHESIFLLNNGRTHFSINWPFMELGRYEGDLPFITDFFGKVDGELYVKPVEINTEFFTPHNEILATMWHAYHVQDMLKQPQSYATIDEIGKISVKYHFLSPYNGFVVPGPSGQVGFKRLAELENTSENKEISNLPEKFSLSAFPNPFNLSTSLFLEFEPHDKQSEINIKIFDSLGRIVKNINLTVPDGISNLHIKWNGKSDNHEILPSGLYFISAKIGSNHQLIKVTLLK